MKKFSTIVFIALFFASCSNSELSKKEAEEKIHEYQNQIAELNDKINELKPIANANDTSSSNILKISVLEVSKTNFEKHFTTSASLEAVNSAFISPEMNGQVKKIYVSEGSFVKQGELLVSLNDNILKSSLVELETALGLAEIVFKKQSELWSKKIGSELEYLQAKNSKESLENKIASLKVQIELTKIKAPISGIIDAINIKVGEMASPGMPIINLVNLDKIYVNANISESYLATLSKGDKIEVSFASFPELNIQSTIQRIGNIVEPGNRTVKIQAVINNTNNKLKPNMIAQVKLNDYASQNSVAIPSILIRDDLDGAYVYIVKENNGKKEAKKQYVKTGKSNNEKTVVVEGLVEGDLVISEGYNLVKNGSLVNF